MKSNWRRVGINFKGLKYTFTVHVLWLLSSFAAISTNADSVIALSFDGKDDQVEIAQPPVLGSTFTEEAWILPQQNDTKYHGIVGNNAESQQRAPGLWSAYGAGLHGGFGDGNKWNCVGTTGETIILGQWNHVAATYDGVTYRVFANGVEVVTKEFGVTPLPQPVTHIGRVGNYFNGAIRDVRLWNRALSAEEIQKGMTQTFTGKEKGLVGCFPLDDGTGTMARNIVAPRSSGTLKHGPKWITSSAPVAPLALDSRAGEARKHIKSYSPKGDDVVPVPSIYITLGEGMKNVDSHSIHLWLDDATVEPEVTDNANGDLLVQMDVAKPFAPGSKHTVKVAFITTEPTRAANEFSYHFTVTTSIVLSK